MTRGGVHRLCFFAQYWIYDLTDLNLSLSTTKQALLPAVHIPGAAGTIIASKFHFHNSF
jgi:hypothetical protein